MPRQDPERTPQENSFLKREQDLDAQLMDAKRRGDLNSVKRLQMNYHQLNHQLHETSKQVISELQKLGYTKEADIVNQSVQLERLHEAMQLIKRQANRYNVSVEKLQTDAKKKTISFQLDCDAPRACQMFLKSLDGDFLIQENDGAVTLTF